MGHNDAVCEIENCTYQFNLEECYSEVIGHYFSYSILCLTQAKTTMLMRDVTTDEDMAKHIVHILNLNQVSSVHMKDVIEDCLP